MAGPPTLSCNQGQETSSPNSLFPSLIRKMLCFLQKNILPFLSGPGGGKDDREEKNNLTETF